MIRLKRGGLLLVLGLMVAPARVLAASEPFDINVQELDRQKPATAAKPERKKVPKQKRQAPPQRGKAHRSTEESGYLRYTVKPGDHIFKILVGRLGMSNDEAERLIPEIVRINKISNIRTLQVGSTLLIPTKPHEHAARTPGKESRRKKREGGQEEAPETPSKTAARAAKCPPLEKHIAVTPAKPAPPAVATPSSPPAPSTAMPKAPLPSAPAPSAPMASEAPGAPVPAPVPPSTPVWICQVTDNDTAKEVDSLLNALSIPYTSNRIIHSGGGAATAFSIRVDRYFEHKGARYVVAIAGNDPYSYTLTRLLETAGYRVLVLAAQESFEGIGEKLLKLIGVPAALGSYPLPGGKEMAGFLVRPEDAAGREVLLTSQPAEKGYEWVMKPGCGVK